jgi:hypothetical protein
MIMSGLINFKMRNVSDRIVDKVKTHILFSIYFFFFLEKCSVYEKVWKNMLKPERPTDGNIIRRVCFACWITKAIHTLRICNSYCFSTVTIVRERALILRYVYINYPYDNRHTRCVCDTCTGPANFPHNIPLTFYTAAHVYGLSTLCEWRCRDVLNVSLRVRRLMQISVHAFLTSKQTGINSHLRAIDGYHRQSISAAHTKVKLCRRFGKRGCQLHSRKLH